MTTSTTHNNLDMALRLGNTAPHFTVETTEGSIDFHRWLGTAWGILFSHPKDLRYTPQPDR